MSLVSRLHFADLGTLVRSGFIWWWQGLSDLIPGYKRLTAKTKKPLFLLVEYHQTTLIIPSDIPAISTVPYHKIHLPSLFDDNSEETVITLANECSGHIVEVSLDQRDVLLLEMTLPKTAQFKLKEAVSFKLITESPLDRESLYFDIQTKGTHNSDIITEVALCIREKVNNVLSILKKAGIGTVTIGFSKSSVDILDFVFYASPDLESARSRLKKNLILLFSFILIIISFLPFIYFAATWIEHNTRQENKLIQHTLDANSQLLAKRALLGTIKIDLNNQIPLHHMTNVLNDLASALPKTSWITSAQYDNSLLQLTGNSPNIIEMMRELNKLSTTGRVKLISVANSNNTNAPSQFEVSIDFHR